MGSSVPGRGGLGSKNLGRRSQADGGLGSKIPSQRWPGNCGRGRGGEGRGGEGSGENKKLSKYVDAQSARAVMFTEVKKLLELNPLVQEKLTFPHNLKKARLRTLINQRFHRLCKNPNPNPGIKTLFEDHLCAQSQPAPGPWMTNTPQVPHPSVFVRPIGLNAHNTSVGTSSGGIMVWELGNKNKLFSRNFNVWDLENCSTALQIEAHIGGVNDIAFTIPNKHVYIITCGDDKLVKFVFSTTIDGKIKAWLYDNQGSRVDYDVPGHSATTIAYNDDGTRFFSFGTNKEGDPYLVEWNETKGSIKHIYLSLLKRPPGIVQFDTTKNILAVGDNFMVKYWDLDNVNLLATTYANGGFSGLLAVSTSENGVKILANKDGVQLLKLIENRPFDASRVSSAAKLKSTSYGAHNVNIGSPSNVDRVVREPPMVPTNRENRGFSYAKSRTIEEYSQCRSLRLTYSSSSTPIKLCLWSADIWVRKTSKYLLMPHGRATSPAIDTCIQFHRDEKHLLAVHEAHIAVYEAPNLHALSRCRT
ncbi:hypothetical protein RD792_014456 [Penstemon davidsonii]|uniref:Uncharacterized protein n=1 Tax=Penstemon davidsonii TaxID=160366 RepID=A0ABR0CQ87_9LAMI|nr:hypothetical protein RD792_014456 [Penstemon davidsonii]